MSPVKPILVYDGECRFCCHWVERLKQDTGDGVEFKPYQTACDEHPELSLDACRNAIHFMEPGEEVSTSADAIFRLAATALRRPTAKWCYDHVPGFRGVSEAGYRFVADRRGFFSWLTNLFYGPHTRRSTFSVARYLFLRALAVIYLIAFLSMVVQIKGLVGQDGLLPVGEFLDPARFAQADVPSWVPDSIKHVYLAPTLFWLDSSDSTLIMACYAGMVLAGLVVLRVFPGPLLLVMWLLYLSLTVGGQRFLSFQWDNLLLESGFLAVFLAPWRWVGRLRSPHAPSRLWWWLLVWLLFRLMFSSGVVKLVHDHPTNPTWRNLTALNYHYETECIPNAIAWYAHQLPDWCQKASVASMFVIEILVPFMFFLPRRPRHLAGALQILLQLAIIATGNYTYFNLLTISLCLLLFDDALLGRFTPQEVRSLIDHARPVAPRGHLRRWAVACFALVMFALGTLEMTKRIWPRRQWGPLPAQIYQYTAWYGPFRSINNYGLFTNMTTIRNEIVIEGSSDGYDWLPYEFKYKPGRVDRMPPFVAPHQPRLDWQMWFAALRDSRRGYPGWFVSLMYKILDGSPEVLALLESDPFPEVPPEFLRARLYRYEFTDSETRRQTGDWWTRSLVREYTPVIRRQSVPRP
ncbi:MAG: lipase maturation factor family protein [Planctomycetota bacterium]